MYKGTVLSVFARLHRVRTAAPVIFLLSVLSPSSFSWAQDQAADDTAKRTFGDLAREKASEQSADLEIDSLQLLARDSTDGDLPQPDLKIDDLSQESILDPFTKYLPGKAEWATPIVLVSIAGGSIAAICMIGMVWFAIRAKRHKGQLAMIDEEMVELVEQLENARDQLDARRRQLAAKAKQVATIAQERNQLRVELENLQKTLAVQNKPQDTAFTGPEAE